MGDTFALDVQKWAKKATAAPVVVMKKLGVDLLAKVVKGTPVGNPDKWKFPDRAPAGYVGGRLRANWNASIGYPDLSTSEEVDTSPDGKSTAMKGAVTFRAANSDLDLYIMNSLPYVRAIEYDHHSAQAPAGMVRVAIAAFPGLVAAAVRETK